jgi:hypothetical protein
MFLALSAPEPNRRHVGAETYAIRSSPHAISLIIFLHFHYLRSMVQYATLRVATGPGTGRFFFLPPSVLVGPFFLVPALGLLKSWCTLFPFHVTHFKCPILYVFLIMKFDSLEICCVPV